MRDTVLSYLKNQNFDKIIEILRDNKKFDDLMKDDIFKDVFFKNITNELFSQEELQLSYPAFLLNCHDSKDYIFKLNEKDEERILMFLFEITEIQSSIRNSEKRL